MKTEICKENNIFENKSFSLAVEKMTDFYKKLSDLYGYTFDVINLGGGIGVWYADGDAKKSCNEYAEYAKLVPAYDTLNKETAVKKTGKGRDKLPLWKRFLWVEKSTDRKHTYITFLGITLKIKC